MNTGINKAVIFLFLKFIEILWFLRVDIGKKLAKTIHEELRSDLEATSHDPSTNNLINYIKVNRA